MLKQTDYIDVLEDSLTLSMEPNNKSSYKAVCEILLGLLQECYRFIEVLLSLFLSLFKKLLPSEFNFCILMAYVEMMENQYGISGYKDIHKYDFLHD